MNDLGQIRTLSIVHRVVAYLFARRAALFSLSRDGETLGEAAEPSLLLVCRAVVLDRPLVVIVR